MIPPIIPSKLEDWNIQVIDSLLPILSIESETFDFKGHDFNRKSEELYNDFCAMANTSGGYIVLGIDEKKAPDGKIIKFIKKGFEPGDEEKINQSIANNMHNVVCVSTFQPLRYVVLLVCVVPNDFIHPCLERCFFIFNKLPYRIEFWIFVDISVEGSQGEGRTLHDIFL